MALEHGEFLTWWLDQHVTIEWADEDIAHAAWQYSRRVALAEAMQISRSCITGRAAFKLIEAIK